MKGMCNSVDLNSNTDTLLLSPIFLGQIWVKERSALKVLLKTLGDQSF